ncbi:hypothetical protein [Kitasatospora phosalacinea]|uniref:hypothetical protein n=1 Tax=Kitasatospora phosalacinea TaxID=2065 RepID=UPI000525D981|nr:hypothetical protein [Kitasatospora phosalacinea]
METETSPLHGAPAATVHAPNPQAACYLRSYPADPWETRNFADALRRLALRHGFSAPYLLIDSGVPSRAADKPALQNLLTATERGMLQVVFVPGQWVFSLDDAQAAAIRDRLNAAGCHVVELPSRLGRRAAAPSLSAAGCSGAASDGTARRALTGRPHRGPRAADMIVVGAATGGHGGTHEAPAAL